MDRGGPSRFGGCHSIVAGLAGSHCVVYEPADESRFNAFGRDWLTQALRFYVEPIGVEPGYAPPHEINPQGNFFR